MMSGFTNKPGMVYKQSAQGSHTATGAESSLTSVTINFPNGSTVKPKAIRVSGSVSGFVQFTASAGQVITIACNPNAPYTEESIPPTAFPDPVNSLAVGFQADGAGTIRAIVLA